MKKLLTRTLTSFTLYALVVLAASIPAYYYLVNSIWLEELDEHNTILADRSEHELNQITLSDRELTEGIALWNKIQPGTNLEKVASGVDHGDSTYTVSKRHPAVQNNELKRFRGLARIIRINGQSYRLVVETNVEESEEIVIAIAVLTFFFFLILVIGFLLLNKRLSVHVWKPFQHTLAELKRFRLSSQTEPTFEPSDTLEFEELNVALRGLIRQNISTYRSQKEFTENASHELQTPLTILKNKLDLLLQREAVSERQYQLIEEMNRMLTRVSRINQNLLLLAKIENRQFDDHQSIAISELIEQSLGQLAEPIESKNLMLSSSILPDIEIDGNKTLTELLINNLLANAIRHTLPGGRIQVKLKEQELWVANTGSQLLNARTLFHRFSKQSNDRSGSGLGLAIVYEICQSHYWSVQYHFANGYQQFTVCFDNSKFLQNRPSVLPDNLFSSSVMRRPIVIYLLFLSASVAYSQEVKPAPIFEPDTLSFIKSKRMSADDLAKKREGTFITGIPDFSSDPVTGFGFGVRSNIYWNGERTNPLFAYTPYLVRLKANVAYYTTNARELILSLDVPYYRGSRWRYRIDFKAQQNPANLYFGSTEKTLGPLRLPSAQSDDHSFPTYEAFEQARKTLRPGSVGEAAQVTDALSNRFRETEWMLNLKADYAIGKGKWRVMGGYEIQNLKYATFEGLTAEAIDPATGQNTTAPNGTSLLRRDFEQGLVTGLNGGWVSIIQAALIYDTRDFEPDPTRGAYVELANEYSSKYIGSQFDFNKLFLQGRYYQKLPWGSRTVLAGRVAAGNIFGDQAPFFEFQDQWSPDGSINALGGKQSLRGYRANRFLARSLWFANVELRVRLAEAKWGKQRFGFGVAPFVDAGTVRDRWQDLNLSNIKTSYGAGLRVAWNQSTILSLDYGRSREDQLIFFGIGQAF
ncbi:Omp85 family outer membrane protein [Spirosoma gilvum]